jgi:myo-inositol-hexaphosphate 3-phosphohydrolase
MGANFPQGFLVVQDHLNDDAYKQNFKIVPWHFISRYINSESQIEYSKFKTK